MSSLEDRLDQDVVGWKPDAGDKVLGTLVTVTEREGEYGPYPYLEVEQSDGSIIGVHAFHTVLKNEIAQQEPEVGDEWGAKYHGKVTGKKIGKYGKPVEFEKYTTVHSPKVAVPPTAPDWNKLQEEAKQEADAQGVNDTIADAFPGAEEESF